MPLMPMPPMPTKCTGPMSRGSFISRPQPLNRHAGPVPGIHVYQPFMQDVDGTRNSGLPELRKLVIRYRKSGKPDLR
jgi:hypothetical protein